MSFTVPLYKYVMLLGAGRARARLQRSLQCKDDGL
jgi:hypothetical protein